MIEHKNDLKVVMLYLQLYFVEDKFTYIKRHDVSRQVHA